MTTLESLEESSRHHEVRLNLLADIAERQQDLIERIDTRIEQQNALLKELKQDTAMTRRLWVRLCKKYGWLEDEDLF